uniref:J domain-containing protein n=1 Tax=Chromera velia CCMP2878 TaxID=1169474 RepID=A0A0G4IDT4_9ALVE|eukprot:Cvel_2368.t1-p1 / transcript=Cvel_2368.t1 / gene=Cvel_2368 / organism=Chromera_velia_CCMP2878 / gene_product=hypothetical protein / transcript_product=hypothetical protein / location=Cvel_scaffold92:24050-26661(-) / protein_length=484 / sequence_SO=supercontig / SO=protein_coding / is_pseudo=false
MRRRRAVGRALETNLLNASIPSPSLLASRRSFSSLQKTLQRQFTPLPNSGRTIFGRFPPSSLYLHVWGRSVSHAADAQGVPFRISRAEAEEVVQSNLGGTLSPGRLLETSPPSLTKTFVPFFAFDVNFDAVLECEWEERNGRGQTVRKRQTVELLNQKLDRTAAAAQILATFAFRRSFAEQLCGPHLGSAGPMEEAIASSSGGPGEGGGGQAEVLPFTIDPVYSVQETLSEKLREHARWMARESIPNPAGSSVSFRRSDVFVRRYKRYSAWLPCFVVDFTRFGQPFRNFVCGATGKFCGPSHYSGVKIGLLAFLALRSFGLFFGIVSPPFSLVTSAVLGVVVHFFPLFSTMFADLLRAREIQRHTVFTQGGGNVGGEQNGGREWSWWRQFEEERYRQTERDREREREFSRGWGRGGGSERDLDLRLLGLDPAKAHSLSEVKAAFRRKALVSHPDKVAESQKAKAEKEFKSIVAAYNRLRQEQSI